ncbi:MAG TPA: winged helix-turn-helix domain-containing protein, partial [Blastocatellia bacterium]|nr:winged helix-turn-helix domain-containing protein [Blastocatellia bacterium]
MSLQIREFYEFGVFRLDPVGRRLLRGDGAVQLAPKAFEALMVLVEGRGRVLDRAELIRRLWPEGEAGDANLAVTISQLRKTLGGRPDGGLYIET